MPRICAVVVDTTGFKFVDRVVKYVDIGCVFSTVGTAEHHSVAANGHTLNLGNTVDSEGALMCQLGTVDGIVVDFCSGCGFTKCADIEITVGVTHIRGCRIYRARGNGVKRPIVVSDCVEGRRILVSA